MKKIKKRLALIAVVLTVIIACSGCGREYVEGSKDYSITLITMDQMDVHWVNVNAGVEDAIAELEADGYTITYNWYAPDTKDNGKQIEQIDMAVSNRSDIIMIAVNDPNACNQALQEAMNDGTRVIYIDSAATLEGEATFATDNYAAGQMAAEELLSVMSEAGITEGQIGLVSAQAGVQSCVDRVDGFCSIIEDTDFTVSEVQYSEGDTSTAQEMATNLINNGAVALFGANEAATIGCGNAATEAVNKVYAVGFDNSSANRALVRKDAIQAYMAQNPYDMGYQGMMAAVDILDGADYDGLVTDTGVTVVTSENVEEFAEDDD